jgi:hypothetical protein
VISLNQEAATGRAVALSHNIGPGVESPAAFHSLPEQNIHLDVREGVVTVQFFRKEHRFFGGPV